MDNNDNSSCDIPLDALVEILVRLPPNTRRRLRLVCRHWRGLIDQRTATDMRSRTKIIVVVDKGLKTAIDLLMPESESWRTDMAMAMARRDSKMNIVGTCNGLVCMCDDELRPGGAITVANPSTGETLHLPPLPMPSAAVHLNNSSGGGRSWHQSYGFAYDNTTGRYKVVHVPSHFDRFWHPDTVHVFTLGEASWRDVRAAGTDVRCSLGCGQLAAIDGTVYWIAEEPGKIMSLDLEHERVTRTEAPAIPAGTYRLAKVHGRLGVAVCDGGDSVTVWVVEGGSWSRRYILEAHKPDQYEKWMTRRALIKGPPPLAHGDNGFLTLIRNARLILTRDMVRSQADGVVQISHKEEGEEVLRLFRAIYQAFEFLETGEPLRVYKAVLVRS